MRRVDLVPAGELLVVQAVRGQELTRSAGELHADNRIVAPVRDERPDAGALLELWLAEDRDDAFDIAGLELFLPLISGAKVVIATREV